MLTTSKQRRVLRGLWASFYFGMNFDEEEGAAHYAPAMLLLTAVVAVPIGLLVQFAAKQPFYTSAMAWWSLGNALLFSLVGLRDVLRTLAYGYFPWSFYEKFDLDRIRNDFFDKWLMPPYELGRRVLIPGGTKDNWPYFRFFTLLGFTVSTTLQICSQTTTVNSKRMGEITGLTFVAGLVGLSNVIQVSLWLFIMGVISGVCLLLAGFGLIATSCAVALLGVFGQYYIREGGVLSSAWRQRLYDNNLLYESDANWQIMRGVSVVALLGLMGWLLSRAALPTEDKILIGISCSLYLLVGLPGVINTLVLIVKNLLFGIKFDSAASSSAASHSYLDAFFSWYRNILSQSCIPYTAYEGFIPQNEHGRMTWRNITLLLSAAVASLLMTVPAAKGQIPGYAFPLLLGGSFLFNIIGLLGVIQLLGSAIRFLKAMAKLSVYLISFSLAVYAKALANGFIIPAIRLKKARTSQRSIINPCVCLLAAGLSMGWFFKSLDDEHVHVDIFLQVTLWAISTCVGVWISETVPNLRPSSSLPPSPVPSPSAAQRTARPNGLLSAEMNGLCLTWHWVKQQRVADWLTRSLFISEAERTIRKIYYHKDEMNIRLIGDTAFRVPCVSLSYEDNIYRLIGWAEFNTTGLHFIPAEAGAAESESFDLKAWFDDEGNFDRTPFLTREEVPCCPTRTLIA